MRPISFILCNYNAPEYFQFCYESLRKNLSGEHEIVLLDDGSSEETARRWMQKLEDSNVVCLQNDENIGIAYSYNRAIEAAKNELVCVLHTDMYVPPGFDAAMLRGMKGRDFICAYRAEPPLYPDSPDKCVADFGSDIAGFDESGFLAWNVVNAQVNAGKTAAATFFPWMTSKRFFTSIGGVDLLFLKYMVDDDDLYLRAKLAGARMAQVRDAAVYHFGSRSTRYAGDALSAPVSQQWAAQYRRSQRNFVRKWGRPSSCFWDADMAIVPQKKYDLGIVVPGADEAALRVFEPWGTNIYVQHAASRRCYLRSEQSETMLDLAERVRLLERGAPENKVILELGRAGETERLLVEKVPELLDAIRSPGRYELGNAACLVVRSLTSVEQEQVVNQRRFAYAPAISEREFMCGCS